MKRLLILLTTVLALPALAEKPDAAKLAGLKHPAKACLWKVEGKGLEKPSWLFGTIHLGDARVVALHPNAEKAFTGADAVYTEIDMAMANQIKVATKLVRKDGKTLSQSIGPELAKALDAELKAINPALNRVPLEQFKTWGVAITVPLLELQLKQQTPLDAVLYERAGKAGKTTGALETADEQMSFFETLEEEEQITMLRDVLKSMKEDRAKGRNGLEELLGVYLTGDASDIADFVTREMERNDGDKELAERMMTALLDKRNERMAANMVKALTAEPGKSHFFAVGAAHYADESAPIQGFLKKAGYTITPAFD